MKGRVLVVEDDADLRDALQEVLESDDYEVKTAASAYEAISVLSKVLPFDVILSDYTMKDGDGIELLKFVRVLDPVRPAFVFVTGQSGVREAEVRGLGAQAFVRKPFRIPDLLDMVERLIPIS